MKVVWAIPKFDNPQTGAEKVFNRMKELFESKGIGIVQTYQENKDRKGVIRKILINLRNCIILIRQDKQSLIFQNLFNRPEFLLANILLCLSGRKIILFIHEIYEINHLSFIQGKYHSFINFISFWPTTLIVVNSKFTGDWVCHFGNFKKKLFLMYPVIDLGVRNSKLPQKSHNYPINILCVGNIRKNKGQIYLLKAMKDFHLGFKIIFVGLIKEKAYMEKLREYAFKEALYNKIEFAGFLSGEQLIEEYEKADIFVAPTLKEGFGMAVLEAMSYGLPVVASNVGAIPEIVSHKETGLLMEPENVSQLTHAIQLLIKNNELSRYLATNAVKCARDFQSIDRVIDDFYEKLSKI